MKKMQSGGAACSTFGNKNDSTGRGSAVNKKSSGSGFSGFSSKKHKQKTVTPIPAPPSKTNTSSTTTIPAKPKSVASFKTGGGVAGKLKCGDATKKKK